MCKWSWECRNLYPIRKCPSFWETCFFTLPGILWNNLGCEKGTHGVNVIGCRCNDYRHGGHLPGSWKTVFMDSGKSWSFFGQYWDLSFLVIKGSFNLKLFLTLSSSMWILIQWWQLEFPELISIYFVCYFYDDHKIWDKRKWEFTLTYS